MTTQSLRYDHMTPALQADYDAFIETLRPLVAPEIGNKHERADNLILGCILADCHPLRRICGAAKHFDFTTQHIGKRARDEGDKPPHVRRWYVTDKDECYLQPQTAEPTIALLTGIDLDFGLSKAS